MTLWDRIGNGIVSAVKKCSGDHEEFIQLVLEFIKAEPGQVARSKEIEEFLFTMESKTPEWKAQLLRMFEKKHNIILVYARYKWNHTKVKKREKLTETREEESIDGFIDDIPVAKKEENQ